MITLGGVPFGGGTQVTLAQAGATSGSRSLSSSEALLWKLLKGDAAVLGIGAGSRSCPRDLERMLAPLDYLRPLRLGKGSSCGRLAARM